MIKWFIILLLCALTPNSTEYVNAFLSWRAVHVIIKQTQVSGVSDRYWPESSPEAAKSLVVSHEFTPQAKWLQRLGGGFSQLRLSFFPQLAANNIDKTPYLDDFFVWQYVYSLYDLDEFLLGCMCIQYITWMSFCLACWISSCSRPPNRLSPIGKRRFRHATFRLVYVSCLNLLSWK